MKYHPVVNQIIELIKKSSFWYESFEHAPVKTSEEAAKIRIGYTLQQGAKAMIVKVKKSPTDEKFAMLVLPGDLRFDNKKVKKLLQAKDICFATPEEIATVTNGVQVGGVPPFGNLFGIEVFADPQLFENEKIIFNAGDRSFSIAMKSVDYQTLVNPQIYPITK